MLQREMNRLANGGTYRTAAATVSLVKAANQWAGTTNLALQGALNAKAGNVTPASRKGIQACLNQIAGTTGVSAQDALRRCT